MEEPPALSRQMEVDPRSRDKRSFLKTILTNQTFNFQNKQSRAWAHNCEIVASHKMHLTYNKSIVFIHVISIHCRIATACGTL